jgi:hypothetical protein
VRTFDCSELIELAPELAAGNLCGEERAAAIAHLDACPSCQQVVNSFNTVTDRLLLLTRRVEPPAGFEQRVLAALPTDLPSRHLRARPRRRWATLVGAAAALVLTFAAGGLLIDRGFAGKPAVAAADMRTVNGDVVGQVFLHEDGRTSLFMSLPGWAGQIERYGPANATYTLRIETTDGRLTSRPVALREDASWAAQLDVDVEAVANVAIVDAGGYVWCHAQFA